MKRILPLVLLTTCLTAHAATLSIISRSDASSGAATGLGGSAPDVDGSGDSIVFASASSQIDAELYALVTSNPPASLALWPAVGAQIYLHDLRTGAQTLISRDQSASTLPGNRPATSPSIDANGRYVAFTSSSGNLTGDPLSGVPEVFRYDTRDGVMHRMSHVLSGINSKPDVANTGAVVYARTTGDSALGDTNLLRDIYLAANTASSEYISIGTGGVASNGASDDPRISSTGRYVVFESLANNLVAGDTNIASDVFLRDTVTDVTTRVSDFPGPDPVLLGAFDPDISYDGRYVVFTSEVPYPGPAFLLPADPQVFLWDRIGGVLTKISDGIEADLQLYDPGRPRIAPRGDYVLFEAFDAIGLRHLVRYERESGALESMERMPVGIGAVSRHAISDDGRDIVFDNDLPPLGIIAVLHEVYRSRRDPGRIEFSATAVDVDEAAGPVQLSVERRGGSDGALSALVAIEAVGDADAALVPYDFATLTTVGGYLLSWDDGDSGAKTLSVPITGDRRAENAETFRLRIIDLEGNAEIGEDDAVVVTIRDDD